MDNEITGVKTLVRIVLWIVVAIIALLIIVNTPSCRSTPPPPLPAGHYIHVVNRQNPMAIISLKPGDVHYVNLAIPRGIKQEPGVTMTLQAVNQSGVPVSPVFTITQPENFELRSNFGNFPMWLRITLAPGATPGTIWVREG